MFVEVNWNSFQAKFGKASEDAFDLLSYLIFCRLHKREFGISGYRNHPGTEKKTISVGNDFVGYQAKFFLDKFLNRKKEIKTSIIEAKKNQPELTVLYFFMPMDHDFSPKKKGNDRSTKAQQEVEAEAAKIGVRIMWFANSEFQGTLAGEEYSYWAAHFFLRSEGIVDFVGTLDTATQQRLSVIHNKIDINGFAIGLDREDVMRKILDNNNPVALYGESGVGKTAVIKTLKDGHSDSYIYVLRPYDFLEFFKTDNLAVRWKSRLRDFFDLHGDCVVKILVIDEAEKVPDTNRIEEFAGLLKGFYDDGWKIIFTAWPSHREFIGTLCKDCFQTAMSQIELLPLGVGELAGVAKRNKFALPSDPLTRDLLRSPFYLNEYLSLPEVDRKKSLKEFKKVLWLKRIQRGNPNDTASSTFVKLVSRKAEQGEYWLDESKADAADLKKLVDRGIIAKDTEADSFYVTHDIYAEWALEKTVERLFAVVGIGQLHSKLPDVGLFHRAYRLWLADKLYENQEVVCSIVRDIATRANGRWRDDTLIAVLTSSQADVFLSSQKELLFANKGEFLKQIVQLVRLSFRTECDDLFGIKGLDVNLDLLKYVWTRPFGEAWETLIRFLFENQEDLFAIKLDEVVQLLCDWCIANNSGETTRKAAVLILEIALRNSGTDFDNHLYLLDCDELVFKALSSAAGEIKDDVAKWIKDYLDDFDADLHGFVPDYCEAVVARSFEHANFIMTNPELTRQIVSAFLLHDKPRHSHYYSTEWAEECMQISARFHYDCETLSALQTPVYWLLKADFWASLKYLIDFLNVVVTNWSKVTETGTNKTIFTTEDGLRIEQYISPVLWCANRGVGSPIMPRLICSMHMALERTLLEMDAEIKDADIEHVRCLLQICQYIIKNAKTASLTGCVSSLVLRNPGRYYAIGSMILSSFDAITCDLWRWREGERHCMWGCAGVGAKDYIFQEERKASMKEAFRQRSLQCAMMDYQVVNCEDIEKRRKRMWAILDEFSKSGDDQKRIFACQTDVRKLKMVPRKGEHGEQLVAFEAELPADIVAKQKARRDALIPATIGMYLEMWASDKVQGPRGVALPDSAKVYDADEERLFKDFRKVLAADDSGEMNYFVRICKPSVAAALLLYYRARLDAELEQQCIDLVMHRVSEFLAPDYYYHGFSGMENALMALPMLCDIPDPEKSRQAMFFTLLGMLREDGLGSHRFCDYIFDSIRKRAEVEAGFERQFASMYLQVRPLFDSFVADAKTRKALFDGRNPFAYFAEKNQGRLLKIVSAEPDVRRIAFTKKSTNALQNVIQLIPDDVAFTDATYKELLFGGIAPVLCNVFKLDDDKDLDKVYLGASANRYKMRLARLLMRMPIADINVAVKELVKVPLAFSEQWFLSYLIVTANELNNHAGFWTLWRGLLPVMVKLRQMNCIRRRRSDVDAALEAYFLGQSVWGERPEACVLIKPTDVKFFEECVKALGSSMGVLNALQSFLNSVGRSYWQDGVCWMAMLLNELPTDGCRGFSKEYFIKGCEQFMTMIVSKYGVAIKRNAKLRIAVQTIIDFLVSKNSQIGHALREAII